MAAISLQFGQLVTILIMAVALGLDAMSLGIGIGMKGVAFKDVLKISIVIAILHVLMPLMGMFMGQYVSTLLGGIASTAGGVLLLLLGGHMIYSSLRGEMVQSFDHTTFLGILIFALSVSIDSFSVGVSLGMFAVDLLLTVFMFGLVGGLMSIIGLLIGQRVSSSIGGYGEACGGAILLAFGIMFIL